MKIIGICGKSIEDLRELVDTNSINLSTVAEYMDSDFSKDSRIILVDNIAKLTAIWDLDIVDADYHDSCWSRRHINYNILDKYLEKSKEMNEVIWQFKIVKDFNLGEFSFITHMNEFNAGAIEFCKKIHNLLTRTKQESIICSDFYKEKLRTLINKEMSELYIDYRNKKTKEVPEIFKYIKYMIETDYLEKDKKEED